MSCVLPSFRGSLMGRALARAFAPIPEESIWQWADATVLLQNEDAAEPGAYRSSKTPWTRRLQELIRDPVMHCFDYNKGTWVKVPVTEVNVQKSSQSGYSEACLNGVRWRATFRPCNTIYAIDSAEEAKKIARRLLRSFKYLDQSIFTGDPDDIKSLEFKLRGMELLFYGSFSSGKFANKQAPFTISDEVEEHGKYILADLASRKKTSTGGLQINLSKPKLKGGPINRAWAKGNREEQMVPCPHCGEMQPLTFFPIEWESPFSTEFDSVDGKRLPRPLPLGERRKVKTGRMVFEHCKNLLGKWDRLRILSETYYECGSCAQPISEDRKRWMIDRGEWMPTETDGTPGIVSQHISDLYSEDELSAWGKIVLDYLDAKVEGFEALQHWYNHRLGLVWADEVNSVGQADLVANVAGKHVWFVDAPNTQGQIVRGIYWDQASAARVVKMHAERGQTVPLIHSHCPAYRRGTVPFVPFRATAKTAPTLIMGSDIGGNYARWGLLAPTQNLRDLALVDWGEELDPDSVRELCMRKTWKTLTGEECRVSSCWMDARWRPGDVYRAALASRGLIIPTKGLGGAAAQHVKLWSFTHVPSYHERFRELHYNDQRAKDALYLTRWKRMRRRLWLPIDAIDDPQLMEECTAERQKQDRRGFLVWSDEPDGPNHYGDSIKEAVVGLDYMLRDTRLEEETTVEVPLT